MWFADCIITHKWIAKSSLGADKHVVRRGCAVTSVLSVLVWKQPGIIIPSGISRPESSSHASIHDVLSKI